MSHREGSKISLTLLKNRAAGQSVPSINFRFNAAEDNVVEVCQTEPGEEEMPDLSSDAPDFTDFNDPSMVISSKDVSPVKEILSKTPGRSSSLDSSVSCQQETRNLDGRGTILSRITKTLEEKMKEIRSDKQREKLPEGLAEIQCEKENEVEGNERMQALEPPCEESSSSKSSSPVPHHKSRSLSRPTQKLKMELGSIRPMLHELRHRKSSSKEDPAKNHGFNFSSLLNKTSRGGEYFEAEDSELLDPAEEACEESFPLTPESNVLQPGDLQISEDHQKKDVSHSSLDHTSDFALPHLSFSCFLTNFLANLSGSFPVSLSTLAKALMGVFVLCFILPIPRFLAGFIFGSILSALVFLAIFKLLAPESLEELPTGDIALDSLPAGSDKIFMKGWMNELEGEYCPETYHVSQTHSIYVRLDGSKLLIDHPRKKISKHARINENIQSGGFLRHREYDLSGCHAVLLPRNLPRKWLWSRKYPICLYFTKNQPNHGSSSSLLPPNVSSLSFLEPSLCSFGDLSDLDVSPDVDSKLSADDKLFNDEEFLDNSFEEVTQDMCQETQLLLFARTDREKDYWFRNLVTATEGSTDHLPLSNLAEAKPDELSPSLNFERYMVQLLHSSDDSDNLSVMWCTALYGRLLYDFIHSPFWANKVQERVQRKLSKLHVPCFVGELILSGVHLGTGVPHLISASPPKMDERGLWVDLEIEYIGNFMMSLETKLDLMKLKRTAAAEESLSAGSSPPSPGDGATLSLGNRYTNLEAHPFFRNRQFDTDEDDSLESSSEDELEMECLGEPHKGGTGPTSKKLLKIVDTLTTSKYFQQAYEWRLLQKAMQGVSNTRIELTVEVHKLAGTLAVNIPPVPSDRIWYGFRTSPTLVMIAKPRLGDHSVSFLAEFIQRQLRMVFEKVFVLPNMDDLVIPVMSPLLPGQKSGPKLPWERPLSSWPFSPNTPSPSESYVGTP